MERSLRDTAAGVSVTYSNGGYSNNLTASHFAVDESVGVICVKVDMSRNLRVRNKGENCYYDACQLVRDHSKLTSIQIDNGQVIKGLMASSLRVPSARWELELGLGNKGSFKYSVQPKGNSRTIFLYVHSEV